MSEPNIFGLDILVFHSTSLSQNDHHNYHYYYHHKKSLTQFYPIYQSIVSIQLYPSLPYKFKRKGH